ncbi:hypothetical protein OROGR_014518 [Orobanche gracilis]
MLGLIDYEAAIHLWKIDKFDFPVCISAYMGVILGTIEIGLVIAVAISVLRVLLFVARPRTFVQGNIPNSGVYRNVITRWIDEEEDRTKATGKTNLQYVIMDMTAVGNIDTSGISMLEEVKKIVDRRGLQLVLVNPGSEVMKKLNKAKFLDEIDSSFIPPLIYAMMGSSRDLAVGTMAVGSLLMASMLGREVNPNENPKLFLHLAFTATFFAGVLQASLGLFS